MDQRLRSLGIKIVFGGPHATYLPYETLVKQCVDIVICGEGEGALVELAQRLEKGETLDGVKGVLYKDNDGQIKDNGSRPLIDDLDSILFPAYQLMDMEQYYPSVNSKFTNKGFASIITSRGCPHRCTFCSHKMFGSKIRFRSVKNVVDEIELLTRKYRIGEFIFLDDTFTVDAKRVMAICDMISNRGLNITWTCNFRANNASVELYSIMRRAGCNGIHIGVESASQVVLNTMKKDISLEQIRNAVRLAKKHIGHVVCGFIFGMPGDTMERAKRTIEFAKELNPDYATFTIATPIPGSELFEEALKKGLIDTKTANWEDFFVFSSVASCNIK